MEWSVTLSRLQATVDVDGLAGEIGCVFRSEEGDQSGNIITGAESIERNGGQFLICRLIERRSGSFGSASDCAPVEFSPHVTRTDAIDAYIVGRQFTGE